MQDSSRTTLQYPSDTLSTAAGDSSAASTDKIASLSTNPDTVIKNVRHHRVLNNTAILTKKTDVLKVSTEKTKPVNFFGNHELKVNHKGPQPLNRITPDWVFPMLILVVIAFAWLRTFYNKYFIQVITAFFNNNLTNQIVRDENILVQRASIVLNIVFNLVSALFLYFVSVHNNWSPGGMDAGLNRYLFFALVVAAAYAMKFLVLKICGYLFNAEREMATYIFNIFLINNVLGILLIPIVALLAFSTTISTVWVMYVSLFLVGGAFLYTIVRGLLVGVTSPGSSLYYLFLYLCTLEIAPLLVLIKILN